MTETLLKKKALAMFQNWASNALVTHPHLNLQIKEYAIFETDLKSAIASGTEKLKENYEKQTIDNFEYGFMCGFIQGNLNSKWNCEYIYKQSNEYKTFAAIKTLESYFKFDEVLAARLNGLYKDFYESTINFENSDALINIDLKKEIIFLSPELVEQKNGFKTAIENVILNYISKFLNKNEGEFLMDVEKYFTKEKISSFIDSVEF